MEIKKLSGDRNLCRGCCEYFNSTKAFNKHRTGEFGKDRRCRTNEEMEAIGMAKNKQGFWVTERMSQKDILRRGETPRNVQNGLGDHNCTPTAKTPQITDAEG